MHKLLRLSGIVVLMLFYPVFVQAQIAMGDIESPVSPAELQSVKAFIKLSHQPVGDNTHNNFVYGQCGTTTEALGMLYEATNDQEFLNLMISYADHMLKERNNPVSGRVIWTGQRELCWPNAKATSPDSVYSGTENGDVVGHIAYCAKLIIQNKAIWNNKVPGGDTCHYGTTYIERAKTYVQQCDKTVQSFILPNFVKPVTLDLITPVSAKYGYNPRADKSRGQTIPWNQQAMQANAFQRLAECFELLHTDAGKVKLYDDIVETYTRSFAKSLVKYTVNGHDCYKWSYSSYDTQLKYLEDVPHAGYDMWGMYRAYHRGNNKYGIPEEVMQNLSNTVYYVINHGNNNFSPRVAAKESEKEKDRNYLAGSWLWYADWNKPLYAIVAKADLQRSKNDVNIAAAILCYKDKLYK